MTRKAPSKAPRKAPAQRGATPRKPAASTIITGPGLPPPAREGKGPALPSIAPSDVQCLRELFWQNVLREMLSGLVALSMREGSDDPRMALSEQERALLDGRLGLMTRRGERVPIASILPIYAASSSRSPGQRAMSAAVERTVFEVRTPGGEVYTLPLHEVRGFHALTPELMEHLAGESGGGESIPFGFAAFTSLARGSSVDEDHGPGAQAHGAD